MDYLELHFFSSQKINTSNTNRVVVATAPRPGEGGRPGRPTNSPHETNDGFVTWMGVFQFEFFFSPSPAGTALKTGRVCSGCYNSNL